MVMLRINKTIINNSKEGKIALLNVQVFNKQFRKCGLIASMETEQ
jgi:hypothetical protein